MQNGVENKILQKFIQFQFPFVALQMRACEYMKQKKNTHGSKRKQNHKQNDENG